MTQPDRDGQKPSSLKREDSPAEASSQVVPREPWPSMRGGPFAMMDRMLDQFFGRDMARDWFAPLVWDQAPETAFFPQIELTQHGDNLEICADLPGLKKEDVKVELRDRDLQISGERRNEQSRDEGGLYRSERSYGSFCRTIRLPEGAKLDEADASFDNGVLRIQIPVPGLQNKQTRSIDIRDASTQH
jgi:HSP20 family protein